MTISDRPILATLLATFALASCQIEEPQQPGEPALGSVSFQASTESRTKTALSQNGEAYDVVWQSGDEIFVTDGAATPNTGRYRLTAGQNSTSGTFTFVAESGTEAAEPDYEAWYPASLYGAGTPAFPATQEYVAGNITGAPMYAESGTTSLSFKNLGGIIRLNISTTQSEKKVRRIILSADQGMSGAISNAATLAADGFAAAVSGTDGVTLDCGESGVAIGAVAIPFHIAVPADTYYGFKITVVTTDGEIQTRTAQYDITVDRSSISTITLRFNNLSSLVQYWPFDGNTNNAIPGGVDAHAWWDGVDFTTDRFGTANGACYLNGGDKMEAPGAALFHQTSFTASVWVNSTQTSGSGNLMQTDGGYYNGWLLRFNGGKVEIWEGRSNYAGYVSETGYADGDWHMLTYVRDVENRAGKLYVDGRYVGGYTTEGTINDDNQETLWFGTYGDGEYYTGCMDDARLYNKALSAEEVLALYLETSAINLSASGTANTYIVPSAGEYIFKATVKGNGGLDPLTGRTATPIDPADISGVTVLWEQGQNPGRAIKRTGDVYDISYSDGYVTFTKPDSDVQSTACVAIFKDGASGTAGKYDKDYDTILWSWLIWGTPEPGIEKHNGKDFMDRNLGASLYGLGGNYARGFLFQWGRKDAFSAAAGDNSSVYWFYPTAENVFTEFFPGVTPMDMTIQHPTARVVSWTSSTHSWMPEPEYQARPWRTDVKTIYDPCPPGWKVPSKEDMDGISDSIFLPDTGLYDSSPASNNLRHFGNADTGYYWTSTISDDPSLPGNAYAYCNDGRNIQNWSQSEGYAIRPVRE